jgi:hypothetical protein
LPMTSPDEHGVIPDRLPSALFELFCDRNVRNRARAQSAGRCSCSYSLFRIADLFVPHHFFEHEHEHRFAEHEYENYISATGICLIPLKPARLETLLRRDKEGAKTEGGPESCLPDTPRERGTPTAADIRYAWPFSGRVGVPPSGGPELLPS